jgi:iron(III) transport system permease protein
MGLTLVLAYFILIPIGFLIWSSFRNDLPSDINPTFYTVANYARAYSSPQTYRLLLNTVVFVFASTLLALAAATALAWLVERTDMPFRGGVFASIVMCSAMPSMLFSMAWIILAGPNAGWLNLAGQALFGTSLFNLFSLHGMILLDAFRSVPTCFLLMLGAMRALDPTLEEAARVCQAKGVTVIRKVTLPLLTPAILAAAIYTGMSTAESFELPALVGMPAGIHVFSSQIYLSMAFYSDFPLASTYAVTLLFLMGLLVIAWRMTIRSVYRYVTVTGKGYRPGIIRLGAWRFPALAVALTYVVIALLMPLGAFLWTSLAGYRPPALRHLFGIDLSHVTAALRYPGLAEALRNSLVVMTVTPVLVLVIAGLAAWFIVKSGRLKQSEKSVMDVLTFLPHAYPGVVLGVALLWVYIIVAVPPLYGTLGILVLAQTVSFLPFVVRGLSAALTQLHIELEEVARVHGASWGSTLRRISLPLIAPALAYMGLWVMIHTTRGVTAPLLLGTADTKLIQVLIWNMWENGKVEEVAVLGALLTIMSLGFALLWRKVGTSRWH